MGQRLLRAHDETITAFAVSNTGQLMASGQQGRNSDVLVWDTSSLTVKFKFQEHDVEIVQLAFSPDDRLLVTIGNERDRKLFLMDTMTGKIVTSTTIEAKRTTAVAWAPVQGPAYMFASSADQDIIIWSIEPHSGLLSGQKINIGSVRRTYTSMVFSANGEWLYAGTESGDVVTVNILRRTVQLVHPVCSLGVGAVMLSPHGLILVGGGDGSISVFNFEEARNAARPCAAVSGTVTSLSCTADGALLVGTAQGCIFRVVPNTPTTHTLLQTQTKPLRALSFTPGGSDSVATCCDDGSISVWGMQDFQLQCKAAEQLSGPALAVALTQQSVISGWGNGFIKCHARAGGGALAQRLWEVPHAHASAHATGVTALKLSTRATFIASGGAGGEVRVWDMRSREMVSHMKLHHLPITDLQVMVDDSHLLSSSDDRTWALWDLHQEKCRATFKSSMGAIRGLALAADQVSVVSVGLDRKVTCWDIRQPDPVRVVNDAHSADIQCVDLNSNATLLATGGADQLVKLWDFRGLTPLAQGLSHTGVVTKLSFGADNRQLASVASDGSLAIWDL